MRGPLARVALLAAFACLAEPAEAAVWAWGCIGTVGDKQVAFNRQKLIVATSRKPLGKLDAIVRESDFTAPKDAGSPTVYQPEQDNGGLETRMTFAQEGDKSRVIVLTEVASRRTGKSDTLVAGCRNEIIERFSKTYRIEMSGEAARTVTLMCMDYQLTTRGGRTCR